MDDQNTPSEPVAETPVQTPEPTSAPVGSESSQPNGSTPIELPPEAPESPISDSVLTPIESQNGGVNQPESDASEPLNRAPIPEPTQPASSAPAPLTPPASQLQSPAQQDQTGFIRALLAKAQAKIQSNKQKKLDKIILFAQKKKIIVNEDIQKLLHVSSATATRYLVRLVQQGCLARVGNPRDAKYQFIH
jgi:hypothetical protein